MGDLRMKLKYLVIFMAIVLIPFFVYQIFIAMGWKSNPKNIPSTQPKSLEKEKDLASFPPPKSRQHRNKNLPWSDFVYPDSVGMRNPFQLEEIKTESLIVEKKSPSFVILTGVLHSEQNPFAIFTDESGENYLVKENEPILDYTVKKILQRSVILKKDDADLEFKVFDEEEP